VDNIMLSIVIIAKNEERNIDRCIKSIYDAKISFPFEIIIVDSNSQDRTIEIASAHPVRIFNLGEKIHHSVAMGRYVGSKFSTGKYILFIDGDMELDANTDLVTVISYFEQNNKIACISGSLEEYVYDMQYEIIRHNQDIYNVEKFAKRYDMGGFYIFKASILEELGNVDIKLDNNEDLELMYRLYSKSYEFYRCPSLKLIHHTKEVYNFKVINLRFKSGRYRDMWTVAALSIKYGFSFKHIITNNFVIAWLMLLTYTLLSLMLLMYSKKYFIVAIVLFTVILIYKIIKKNSLKVVLFDLYYATLAVFSIFQKNHNNPNVDLREVSSVKTI